MRILATTITCLGLASCGGGGSSNSPIEPTFPTGVWEQLTPELTARANLENSNSILDINGDGFELHQFIGGEHSLHTGVVSDGVVVSGDLAEVMSTVTITGDYKSGSKMFFTSPNGEAFTSDFSYSAPVMNDALREAYEIPITEQPSVEPVLDLPVVGVWEIEPGDFLFVDPENTIYRAQHDPHPSVFCVKDIEFIAHYDERDGRIFSDEAWLMNSQMTRVGSELLIENLQHGAVQRLNFTLWDVGELTNCPGYQL